MLSLVLILSAVLVVLVYVAARTSRRKSYSPAIVSLVAIFASACFPAVSLNALLVCLAALACRFSGSRPLSVLLSSLGATICSYLLVIFYSVGPELRKWSSLEEQYPLESIAARLAYERRPDKSAGGLNIDAANSINTSRLTGLEARAQSLRSALRTSSLERLHSGAVQQFINSQGFGVGRMPLPGPERLNPQAEDEIRKSRIEIPETAPTDPGDSTIHGGSEPGIQSAIQQHEENVLLFANAFDLGYVRDRDHVAGFVPHEFAGPAAGFRSWRIDKLELVSLLKFEAPAVYISAELPKMRELKDAKTRPPDSFESQALGALRQGEDLQVQFGPDSIRMLGSIRALKQCIKCHSMERGDLLGAFSYQLRPERK